MTSFLFLCAVSQTNDGAKAESHVDSTKVVLYYQIDTTHLGYRFCNTVKIQIRSKIQIRQFSNKYFWIISYLSVICLIWFGCDPKSIRLLHLDIFNWINLMELFLYRLVIDSPNENVYLNTYVKCAYDKITWRLKHFIFHHDTDT